MNSHKLSRAEVTDIVSNAPTKDLERVAADPEFRKGWKYDPAWIDIELKRRAGKESVLPPSTNPEVAAKQAEIEAKANEQYAPKPAVEPEVPHEETGKPYSATLYHGTRGGAEELDKGFLGLGTGAKSANEAFFFTKDEGLAQDYADMALPKDILLKRKAIQDLENQKQEMLLTPLPEDEAGISEANAKYEDLQSQIDSITKDVREFYTTRGRREELGGLQGDKEATVLKKNVQLENPLVVEYKGNPIRETTYAEQIEKAKKAGHDGVIFKNTFDPASAYRKEKLTDIVAVFPKEEGKLSESDKPLEAPVTPPEVAEPSQEVKTPATAPIEAKNEAPAPYSPEDRTTSVKNATVEEDRIARGLPEREEPLRRSFGTVWDDAKAQVEADPTKGARLVEEMNKKPRPISDTESAILLDEKIKRDNEFDNAVDAVNNAKDGVEREDATRRLEAAREQVQRAYEATEVAGTKAGQALAARKMMVDKDEFTLARMESVLRATANDGSPLSDKQLTQVKEAHDKINELQKRVTELEDEARTKRINEYFNKLLTDTKKEVKQTAKQGVSLADFLDIQANKARERVAQRRREGRFMSGLDPVDLADHVIIGADYLAKGVTKLADFTSRLVKDFGEELRPHAQEIFDKANQYQSELSKEQAKNQPKVLPAQKKIDQYTKAVETRTKKLEEKIKAGDYTRKTPQERQLDAKAKKALYDYETAKKKWNEGLLNAQLAKRPAYQKVFGKTVEGINLARAVMTSFDLSAVLRQGGFISLAHPIRAAKSFPAMLKAFGSKRGEFEANKEIEGRPNYPLYKQSKLALTSENGSLSQMEEAYMSRWAKHIPLVAASERAYTTFLNKLRADSFDAMARGFSVNGKPTAEEARAISNFINVATGRADLGRFQAAGPALNTVFFSPKYVASRFQLLGGQPLYKGTWGTRKAIAGEYARYLAAVGTIYALSQAAGATVEKDPRSADYGKIKIGNTRIDPLSGLAQVTTFLSRIGTGQTKDSHGKVVQLRDSGSHKVKFGGRETGDVVASFLRTKLAPAPGAIANLITGKNAIGQPITPAQTAKQLVVPLTFGDIAGAMQEQGVPRGTAIGLLSILGAGVQTYDNSKPFAPSPR